MPDELTLPGLPTFQFLEELYEAYANNILYEASVWDLKILFGQLDQSGGLGQIGAKGKIVMHSAITLPWAQVKLMTYWLRAQIEVHEKLNGKIKIPPGVVPQQLPAPTEEMKKSDPNAEAVFEIFNKMQAEFVAILEK